MIISGCREPIDLPSPDVFVSQEAFEKYSVLSQIAKAKVCWESILSMHSHMCSQFKHKVEPCMPIGLRESCGSNVSRHNKMNYLHVRAKELQILD